MASYVHVCFVGVRLGRRGTLSLGKFRSGVFRYGRRGELRSVLVRPVGLWSGRQGGVSFVVVRWYELG